MPRQHRQCSPAARDGTRALIDDNFLRQSKVTSIDGSGYARLLRAAPAGQVRGGRVYDAVVVACAVKARASTILTFNGRHFRALVPDGVTVCVPGGS